MSLLIDGQIFHDQTSQPLNYINYKNINNLKTNHRIEQSSQFEQKQTKYKPSHRSDYSYGTYIHRHKNMTLVISKVKIQPDRYKIEGNIFIWEQRFLIKFKQKRILFGKEWLKRKVENNRLQLKINMITGQLKIFGPQYLNFPQQRPNRTPPKKMSLLSFPYIQFFQLQVYPLIQALILHQPPRLTFTFMHQQNHDLSNLSQDEQLQRLEKYLFMSTVVDTFSKGKESYKIMEGKLQREREAMDRLRRGVDFTFASIGQELALYREFNIKRYNKRLSNVCELFYQEKKAFDQLCMKPGGTHIDRNQQKFVLNCIEILKIENKKKFINSGGFCNLFLMKIHFQYVFSDDPKFWSEQNKKRIQNIIQKKFIIKQAQQNYENKIKHQLNIIKQMKGSSSLFLPKYYKIQNFKSQNQLNKPQQVILMDYLPGPTMQQYLVQNQQILSFWTKIFILKNLVGGLRFLSSSQIVHLDIKPNNIIISNDLVTKIIDFGESYHPKVCQKNYLPGTSLPYICPQVVTGNSITQAITPNSITQGVSANSKTQVTSANSITYTEKCDVFSVGVIMYLLFCGEQPFQLSRQKVLKLYKQKDYYTRMLVNVQSHQESSIPNIFNIILTLMMRCMHPNPDFRPTLNWMLIIFNSLLLYYRSR